VPEASVEEVAQCAAATGRIALDTEFMSEGRYFARLCLVQFAAEGADGQILTATVDPLSGDEPGPMLPVLSDPGVEVVVHAGRQDLGLLQREWRSRTTNVFDTQIAAALTSTSQQSSYQFLVGNLLGRSLRKSESFTRWDQRPLTPQQLAYARQDVEHLLPIAAALRKRLETNDRLEWARAECRLLETAVAEERDPEEQFRRLAAGTDMSSLEAAVARELVFWRDETAREQDRPVRSVIPDRLVTQLARRRPASLDALKQERGVGEGVWRRYGNQIVATLRKGEQATPVKLAPRPEQPPWFAPLTSLCEALVRARCEEQQVAKEIVATRDEIGEVVLETVQGRPEPPNRLLSGWRREMVGEEVLELLRGERSLRVGQDGHLVVDRQAG
jgi:ribonuclease D